MSARAAYYNEHDPFAASWLRALIAGGHIASGDVDERDIRDVDPSDLEGYAHVHFFAGIGGWSAALQLAGWPDERPVWTGSCPCQPFSAAGKRGGADDSRHLWPAFYKLIAECGPATLFGEQVAGKTGRTWLAAVRADLEHLGYACGAADLPAAGGGAPQARQRLWFVGDAEGQRRPRRAHDPDGGRREQPPGHTGAGGNPWSECDWIACRDDKARPIEPGTFPLAHGVPARLGRLRGYGNAIVPQVAAAFIAAGMDAMNAVGRAP